VETGAAAASTSGGGISSIRNKAAMFERCPENSNNPSGGAGGERKVSLRTPANPYKRWMADKVNLSLSVAAEDEDGSVLHLDTSNLGGGDQSSRSSPGGGVGAGNSPSSGGGGGASSPHSPHSGGQLAGLRARRSVANNYAATPLGKRDRTAKLPSKAASPPPPQEPVQEPVPASPTRNDTGADSNNGNGNVGSGLMSPTVSSLLTSGALKRQRASAQAAAAAAEGKHDPIRQSDSGERDSTAAAVALAVAGSAESPEKATSGQNAVTTPMKGPSMAEKMGDEKYQVYSVQVTLGARACVCARMILSLVRTFENELDEIVFVLKKNVHPHLFWFIRDIPHLCVCVFTCACHNRLPRQRLSSQREVGAWPS